MVRIGVDFDNTIVTYDSVFHRYGAELGLIPASAPRSKREVRDRIRRLPDGNARWTELQGLVYGLHMDEAEPAAGVLGFLHECRAKEIGLSIISHKTRYPAAGALRIQPVTAMNQN